MDGSRFFKANDFLWMENQRLREENRRLRGLLNRREKHNASLAQLQQRCEKLEKRNARLQKRVADLMEKLTRKPQDRAPVPPFVKPQVKTKKPRIPGRKAGHPAALRPKPARIDVHQNVDLPVDGQGKSSCPHCKSQLLKVKRRQYLVEDLVPARVICTCYHTASGWCPCCRKIIESRAPEQPPPADLPHAQLGLNALATAAVMRVCYRLPLRQISRLLAQVPHLKVSPGAIVKQIKRLSKWLEKQYHRLKLLLRAAGVVYADETSWRTGGKNTQLWTLSNDRHTLYHVDRSRGGQVIADLLGEGFGSDGRSTLVSDFYGVYDQFDGPQQKCLAHLLRELKETMQQRPELAGHTFFRRCRRLVKQMLALKTKRGQLGKRAYEHQVQLLENRLAVLSRAVWNDADADRLAARLRKHDGKLTTFLHRPEVDGTNNAAERALRPAVVMRKITGGSRSEAGARAWAILASVMRTAEQQGRDVLETIKTLLKAEWAGKNIALLTDLLTPAEPDTS